MTGRILRSRAEASFRSQDRYNKGFQHIADPLLLAKRSASAYVPQEPAERALRYTVLRYVNF